MRINCSIIATMFVALLLSIVPAPSWFNWVRIDWPLLVLIYWSIAAPERIGVFSAGMTGLIVDSLSGSVIGMHIMGYAVVISITANAYRRLRVYDVWQQAVFVFLFVGMAHLLEHWLALLLGQSRSGLWFILPSIISAFMWPWLVIVLRAFRRRIGLTARLI